ncbi:MAG: DUF4870 domain-containing protein [Roseibacillus sp.]
MNSENGPPPLQQHQQPPPGLPHQVITHPDNPHAPYAPNDDERTMAMLVHLLGLLTGFVGPLILWLVKRETSHYIDHHGKECVNFMITTLIVSIPMLFIVFITFGIGFILYIPWIIMIYVFDIMACIQAYKGSWHRIPLTIRLIK